MAKSLPGIVCPKCSGPTDVIESRHGVDYVRRRRACHDIKCNTRVTTIEVVNYGNDAKLGDSFVLVPKNAARDMCAAINGAFAAEGSTADEDDGVVSPTS